jgi:hypothetical protein
MVFHHIQKGHRGGFTFTPLGYHFHDMPFHDGDLEGIKQIPWS